MTREIQVVANSQNRNEVFMSNAETVGQLKAELTEKGYALTDVDIKEGKSRTVLDNDATVLPTDFMYKGVQTSDLVILITPKNSKIKSGSGLYDIAEALRNAANQVEDFEVPDCDNNDDNTYVTAEEVEDMIAEHTANCPTSSEYTTDSLAFGILKMINSLERLQVEGHPVLSHETCETWRRALKKNYSTVSAEEIDEMLH